MPLKNLNTPTTILKQLVAFDTTSHKSNLPLANFLAENFDQLGFAVEFLKDEHDSHKTNLICTIGPQKAGGLVVSGHMDVVPTEGQPWITDPFCLTEKNGKLFGRGTADMKGFIACTLFALAQMDLKKIKEPLCLIWTYDEEIGCRGSFKLAETFKNTPRLLPDEAIVGEPTDFKIFRMHPGHVTIKINTTGLAAHSSKPDLGKNAIKTMQIVLSVLEKLAKDLQNETKFDHFFDRPYVTLNVGIISGGTAVNIVPDNCEIIVGYRPMPGDDPLEVLQRIKTRLQEQKKLLPTEWGITLINCAASLLTPNKQPLENILLPFASEKCSSAASFATDAGNLAAMGIKSLIFGPGSIDVAHKANEYIEQSALIKATEILKKVIQQRCRTH